MTVNGTDYSHILWKVIKFMFQTTNQLYQYCWVLYSVFCHISYCWMLYKKCSEIPNHQPETNQEPRTAAPLTSTGMAGLFPQIHKWCQNRSHYHHKLTIIALAPKWWCVVPVHPVFGSVSFGASAWFFPWFQQTQPTKARSQDIPKWPMEKMIWNGCWYFHRGLGLV